MLNMIDNTFSDISVEGVFALLSPSTDVKAI
jgi:hypothetical protein